MGWPWGLGGIFLYLLILKPKLKYVSKVLAQITVFFISSTIFVHFTQTPWCLKGIHEHYMLSELLFEKSEKEGEKFQFL